MFHFYYDVVISISNYVEERARGVVHEAVAMSVPRPGTQSVASAALALPALACGDAALPGTPPTAPRRAAARYARFTSRIGFSPASSGLPPVFPRHWRAWRAHPGLVLPWQWRSPRNEAG